MIDYKAVLGLAFGYHDSSTTFVGSENEVYADHEERFSRIKFDASFPQETLDWLNSLNLLNRIESVYFYENPDEKRKRIYHQALSNLTLHPKQLAEVLTKAKLTTCNNFEKYILSTLSSKSNLKLPRINFVPHHLSHASSTFFSSNFSHAAILVMDGVGERTSTSIWKGSINDIHSIEEFGFPNSIGLFYAAFAAFCGFKVNSGEYKFMGLAPYGKPIYVNQIRSEYAQYGNDGSYRVQAKRLGLTNFDGFNFNHLEKTFGQKRRDPQMPLTQFHADLASSVQTCLNEMVLFLAKRALSRSKSTKLVIAGGVGLNCVANQYIVDRVGEENVHFFSASGDAGGSFGAAALGFSIENKAILRDQLFRVNLLGSKLGREFSRQDCKVFLSENQIPFEEMSKVQISKFLADEVLKGSCIGIFEGRSEFGPRALGNRSIIANPLIEKGQIYINQKIKFRESFRPFAPIVMSEYASNYFEMTLESPYMLRTVPVIGFEKIEQNNIVKNANNNAELSIWERLETMKSPLPSVTHLDGSARVQTLGKSDNSFVRKLLEDFYLVSGCPVLVNTSFNVRGEPIVGSPLDALNCFVSTGLDYLYLQGLLVSKKNLPKESFSKFKANVRDD